MAITVCSSCAHSSWAHSRCADTNLCCTVPLQNRATVNGAYSSAVYLGGGIAALSVFIAAL